MSKKPLGIVPHDSPAVILTGAVKRTSKKTTRKSPPEKSELPNVVVRIGIDSGGGVVHGLDHLAELRLSPRPFKNGVLGYFGTTGFPFNNLEVKVMIGQSLSELRKLRGKKK